MLNNINNFHSFLLKMRSRGFRIRNIVSIYRRSHMLCRFVWNATWITRNIFRDHLVASITNQTHIKNTNHYHNEDLTSNRCFDKYRLLIWANKRKATYCHIFAMVLLASVLIWCFMRNEVNIEATSHSIILKLT